MAQKAPRKIAYVEGSEEQARGYWRANIRLILTLLAIWALVSYGVGYILAGALQGVNIGAVPFPFWMVQQGAIIVFVILIFVYARVMDRIDSEYGVSE